MKASEFGYSYTGTPPEGKTDDLVTFLETENGKNVVKELDKHWSEVMKLAEKYGFIVQAYGGVSILSTHDAYKEEYGSEGVAKRLRMCNVELGDA